MQDVIAGLAEQAVVAAPAVVGKERVAVQRVVAVSAKQAVVAARGEIADAVGVTDQDVVATAANQRIAAAAARGRRAAEEARNAERIADDEVVALTAVEVVVAARGGLAE